MERKILGVKFKILIVRKAMLSSTGKAQKIEIDRSHPHPPSMQGKINRMGSCVAHTRPVRKIGWIGQPALAPRFRQSVLFTQGS